MFLVSITDLQKAGHVVCLSCTRKDYIWDKTWNIHIRLERKFFILIFKQITDLMMKHLW